MKRTGGEDGGSAANDRIADLEDEVEVVSEVLKDAIEEGRVEVVLRLPEGTTDAERVRLTKVHTLARAQLLLEFWGMFDVFLGELAKPSGADGTRQLLAEFSRLLARSPKASRYWFYLLGLAQDLRAVSDRT